jgi:glutamate--cysteine ligase catalytic subunit
MLEATPGAPWGIGFKDLLSVEGDMRWRCVLAVCDW